MPYIKPKPKKGEKYRDHAGRTLLITEVNISDANGREVLGLIKERGPRSNLVKFSTTLEMWRETWRDKKKPVPVGSMKVG